MFGAETTLVTGAEHRLDERLTRLVVDRVAPSREGVALLVAENGEPQSAEVVAEVMQLGGLQAAVSETRDPGLHPRRKGVDTC